MPVFCLKLLTQMLMNVNAVNVVAIFAKNQKNTTVILITSKELSTPRSNELLLSTNKLIRPNTAYETPTSTPEMIVMIEGGQLIYKKPGIITKYCPKSDAYLIQIINSSSSP